MISFSNTARVVKGALVILNPVSWRASLAHLEGKDVVVTVETEKSKHSKDQRGYWRGVVVPHIAAFEAKRNGLDVKYPNDAIHDTIMRTFWPCIITSMGAMRESTANFSVEDFSLLIDKVKAHYATLGLRIPEPNEPPDVSL